MQRTKEYDRAIFSAPTIRAAIERFAVAVGSDGIKTVERVIRRESETWDFDTDAEFYDEYSQGFRTAIVDSFAVGSVDRRLRLTAQVGTYDVGTSVLVQLNSKADIAAVMNVFEDALPQAIRPVPERPLPRPPSPTIFIGHGRDPQWRDLKDHLHEQHKYDVEAYETGARAGHAIRDILEEMLTQASFAVLVLTGEDATGDHQMRARQNVVHEVGLFQGKLGFARAIVLLEEGVEDFSNVSGIHQIRFSKGGIRETYGDVLATLRREFGS